MSWYLRQTESHQPSLNNIKQSDSYKTRQTIKTENDQNIQVVALSGGDAAEPSSEPTCKRSCPWGHPDHQRPLQPGQFNHHHNHHLFHHHHYHRCCRQSLPPIQKASTNLISDRMLFIDVKYDYTITLLRKPILRTNIGYKGPWFHSKIKKNSIHNTSMITVAHR